MSRVAAARAPIAAALAVGIGLGVLLPGALGNGSPEPTAIRHALAQTSRVQGAPGRELVLSKVVIQPGAKLATHNHRGSQVARIVAGALRYSVHRGAAVVRRGESDGDPRVVRRIAAGQTGTLRAGDWIVEQPSDIHSAANRGRKPVVVYLATLLKHGAPPASPVTLPSGN